MEKEKLIEEKELNSCLCAFKDKKANIYTAPLTFKDVNSAIRYFDSFSEKNLDCCDFDLYLLGYYSDVTGQLVYTIPELIRSGDFYYEKIKEKRDLRSQIEKIQDIYLKELDSVFVFFVDLIKKYDDSYDKNTLNQLYTDFKCKRV